MKGFNTVSVDNDTFARLLSKKKLDPTVSMNSIISRLLDDDTGRSNIEIIAENRKNLLMHIKRSIEVHFEKVS